MKKDVFEKNWSDKFANVRNMIAGTANAKESFPERWNDIDPEAWIDEGLPDVDYVQAVFKCEDCGARGHKQIRSHDAERQSLFMPH